MAAMEESLRDLELIMDANLASATAATASEPQGAAAAAIQEQQEEEEVAAPPPPPPPLQMAGVASLSLALGSMMSSNFVLSKVGVLPRSGPLLAPSHKKAQPSVPPSSKFKLVQPESKLEDAGKKKKKSLCKSAASAFPDYQMLPTSGKMYASPAGGAGMKKASIVWFRSDLRVHDNEALSSASAESLSVIPVYCFDPRDYGKSTSGFDKTGPYRAKFLLECVSCLRDSLRQRGSDLVVRVGNPEEVLSTIAKAVGADGLYAHQEVSAEELLVEDRVSAALKEQGVEAKFFWGSTLYHLDDLPFKLEDMPQSYGIFRDKVKSVQVRPAAQASKQLKGLPSQGDVKPGAIPTLQELGLSPSAAIVQKMKMQDKSGKGGALVGGEEEALQRLQRFSAQPVPVAADSSIYGTNFSCKISPWLAMGCLSPRRMFEELNRFNVQPAAQASDQGPGLQWLVCELLWRDFFRFVTKKYGAFKKNQSPAPAFAV